MIFSSIYLTHKRDDFTSEQTAATVIEFLKTQGCQVVSDVASANKIDLIIVIGGDGSILNIARQYVSKNIPILGINLGRLGFLADVSTADMFNVLSDVLKGDFSAENRILLSAAINKGAQTVAINDVVIHKHTSARMIEFEVYVDNKFVNHQRADGLIIATPTGSTAYSLSSGGAIMQPTLKALSLVSICPHTLSHRPLVIDASSSIAVNIIDIPDDKNARVILDGQIANDIVIGDCIQIKQHNHSMTLIHPKSYQYFEVVRNKLKWGGKL